jgi:AcrR family transcriptional regulator
MTRKRELARETILLAAEGLLDEEGRSDFSMRELSAAAGMSFVTPFNLFGSKDGLLCELMFRRLALIQKAYDEREKAEDAISRVLLMAEVGVELLLAKASVTRAISLGIASDSHGQFTLRATKLWEHAMGDGEGLDTRWSDDGAEILPRHLAVFFRGALVMWVARDLSDEQFRATVIGGVALTIASFANPRIHDRLADTISKHRRTLAPLSEAPS